MAINSKPPEGSPAPSAIRRPWIWATIGLAVVVLGGLAFAYLQMNRPQLVAIEIAAVAPTTRVLAINGRIAAVHSVDIRPLVGGRLDAISVAEGENVTEGQILATINADNQNAVLLQAQAGLEAALVAQKKAEEAFERALKLGNTIARIQVETADHAVQSARQEVARQTALLDQARLALVNHTIRAPLSGNVLRLNVDAGQIVDPATVLLTVANLDQLVVETNVDEAYARQVATGQSAILQLAGEIDTHSGHVSFVSTRVDPATGGLAIRITFDNRIKAPIGLTVTANIIVEEREAALTLPRSAIVSGKSGSSVFVVENGKANLKPVKVLEWPAARLIVTDGLSAGNSVIVDASGIVDGAPVRTEKP
ncbi:MAG: efflux RND transporter periplasmic adaptor subunit [Nitratireductor sp.]